MKKTEGEVVREDQRSTVLHHHHNIDGGIASGSHGEKAVGRRSREHSKSPALSLPFSPLRPSSTTPAIASSGNRNTAASQSTAVVASVLGEPSPLPCFYGDGSPLNEMLECYFTPARLSLWCTVSVLVSHPRTELQGLGRLTLTPRTPRPW